jgi:hypothetical protein
MKAIGILISSKFLSFWILKALCSWDQVSIPKVESQKFLALGPQLLALKVEDPNVWAFGR